MTEPGGAAAAAPAPLSPPQGVPALTLTAPEPVAAVAITQAPAMAPQVDPKQLPATVKSLVAQKLSLARSLFERLQVQLDLRVQGLAGSYDQ